MLGKNADRGRDSPTMSLYSFNYNIKPNSACQIVQYLWNYEKNALFIVKKNDVLYYLNNEKQLSNGNKHSWSEHLHSNLKILASNDSFNNQVIIPQMSIVSEIIVEYKTSNCQLRWIL